MVDSKTTRGITPIKGTAPRTTVSGSGASNIDGLKSFGPLKQTKGITPRPSGDPMTNDIPAKRQVEPSAGKDTPRPDLSNPLK